MKLANNPGENRIERKKKMTRQKIIDVALALFSRQGFDNTTMEQIAAEADVARKTLYNHFPVKEAIAGEYVKQISKELAQETFSSLQRLPDTRSRLLAALNNAYGWVKFNPEITRIVLAYRFKYIYQAGAEAEKTGTQQVLAEILRAGQQAGEIKSDISVELMATYLDMLRGVMAWEWVNDTESFELSDRIARLVDMVLYGISTSKESS